MKTEMAHAIRVLVETLLPRGSEESLYVCVDSSYSVFQDSEDFHKRRYTHFLFHRPNNYTKVFVFMTDDPRPRFGTIPNDCWELKSDHDSCWSTDGVESPLFKTHCELRETVDQECLAALGRKASNVHEFNRFSVFNSPKLVKTKLTRIESGDQFRKKYIVEAA